MIYKTFVVKTKPSGAIDITENIEKHIQGKNGMVLVFTKHTTAAITIMENYDPNIEVDFDNFLRSLIPKGVWKHDIVDDNGDAHIKSSLIGQSLTLPVRNGKLDLGTWQRVVLLEFDGPRNREITLVFVD